MPTSKLSQCYCSDPDLCVYKNFSFLDHIFPNPDSPNINLMNRKEQDSITNKIAVLSRQHHHHQLLCTLLLVANHAYLLCNCNLSDRNKEDKAEVEVSVITINSGRESQFRMQICMTDKCIFMDDKFTSSLEI